MSHRITIRTVHWLLAAAIAAAAGGAWARNDKLLLPIAPALRSGPQLPPDIPFETAELSPMARSFYGESKRVSNQRSLDLGF